MRGKLEQAKALIELRSIEVERIDSEYFELWVSFEYACPGGEYKSAMAIPISNSMEMTNHFFRELIKEARNLSEMEGDESTGVSLIVSNKASTMLHIKNLYQRVIDVLNYDGPLEENGLYIDLCTSGFDFRASSNSLSSKNFDERFMFFMARAKDKMSNGYFTIAADDLEKAKILCSSSPVIYKLIGICHKEIGHLDLALEMLQKSLELGDEDKETFLYIAEIHFFMSEMDDAADILSNVAEKYKDDCRILVELANVYYQQDKDYLPVLDKAFSINPEQTRQAVMQTFVFKKTDKKELRKISLRQSSTLLGIPSGTILSLAARHRIPTRQELSNEDVYFDEDELSSWAFVYRRFGLLEDEIERISVNTQEDKGVAVLS
jgi:tetratricopeptide (TPR) repeat protein